MAERKFNAYFILDRNVSFEIWYKTLILIGREKSVPRNNLWKFQSA